MAASELEASSRERAEALWSRRGEVPVWWEVGVDLVRVWGPDAERFLNGQMTQDARRLGEGEAMEACVTNAKGQLEFYGWARAWPEAMGGGYVIDVFAGEGEGLAARLDRYLIADECEVELVGAGIGLAHMAGVGQGAMGGAAGLTSWRCRRAGMAGLDLLIEGEGGGLHECGGARRLGDEEVELVRVWQGVAAWGKELKAGVLPPEAGLGEVAISYTKGCYIGQEVLSRMKSAGKVRRLMRVLEGTGDGGQMAVGMEIVGEGGRALGEVSSSAWHPGLDRPVGLGYIKGEAAKEGGRVRGADGCEYLVLSSPSVPYFS
jgi:tRNA-modifying protein YgfZ